MLLELEAGPMSAAEIISRLKTDRRLLGVPVALLSAHAQLGAQAALLGCDGCLSKPISVAELLALVDGFLAHPSPESCSGDRVRIASRLA
jgi:CheY-like chemotaxis protein